MVKSFAYGILVGLVIGGILWFSFGRNDLRQIRKDYERASDNLERVQQTVSELSTNSDGFAGDITSIDGTAQRIEDRSKRLDKGLTGFEGGFRDITVKVDKLEKWNRRSVILGRDFGDKLFDLRQLNKASSKEK